MNLVLNTPNLYQNRINILNEQLKSVTSKIIRDEITKSIIYTDSAITAYADLQKSLASLPDIYNSKDNLIQDKLSSIYNEMDKVIKSDLVSQNEFKEFHFNFLKVQVGGIYSLQDLNITIINIIFELGVIWLNLLNSILEGEGNDLTRDKIAFIAKLIGGQIPYLSSAIEIMTSIADAITINVKDAKASDEFLNNNQKYQQILDMYIWGSINFRLDSISIMNDQPILTVEKKNIIIQNHYNDIIECKHELFINKV
ncbi:TPA: hypothetical protein ACSTNG_002583 [Serratia fonticola]